MYNHQDVLKYLSSEDKEELALWEGLLTNPGFALLLQKLSEQHLGALSVLANAPHWDAYNYYRGVRDALDGVLNLEQTLEFTVQQKVEAAQAVIETATEVEEFV